MRYKPYTEAQIQSMNIMEEGIYPFRVIEIITTDKFGNSMQDKSGIDIAKLKLLVQGHHGEEKIICTHVHGDGTFAYKLRNFAITIGMIEEYENGTFKIEDTVGKSGNAQIVIKKGGIKKNGSGEMWPDRNDIKDFSLYSPLTSQETDEVLELIGKAISAK